MRIVVNVFAAIFACFLSGCGTIFTGSSDIISFKSNPSDATVYINGVDRGQTPTDVKVKRKLGESYAVLKKTGYEDKTLVLEQELNGVCFLNLLNVLAWAIDAATGSAMKYSVRSYDAKLSQQSDETISSLNASSNDKKLDLYSEVKKLNELKEKKVISEEEYIALKAKVMGDY